MAGLKTLSPLIGPFGTVTAQLGNTTRIYGKHQYTSLEPGTDARHCKASITIGQDRTLSYIVKNKNTMAAEVNHIAYAWIVAPLLLSHF